ARADAALLAVPLAHPDDDGSPVHAVQVDRISLELRDGVWRHLDFKHAWGPAVPTPRQARTSAGLGLPVPPGEGPPHVVAPRVRRGRPAKLVAYHLLGVLRQPVGEPLEVGVHGRLEDLPAIPTAAARVVPLG